MAVLLPNLFPNMAGHYDRLNVKYTNCKIKASAELRWIRRDSTSSSRIPLSLSLILLSLTQAAKQTNKKRMKCVSETYF